jgi:hypothetical protein
VPLRKEADFEALRKRADSLEAYAKLLEDIIAKCVCRRSGDVLHLQNRPEEMAEDYSSDDLGSDEGISQELCVPTENLKVISHL